MSRSSPNLLSLPVELHEEIAANVAWLPAHNLNDDRPLVSLDVYRLLDDRDVLSLLNWSSTSKWFRQLLGAQCFEAISLWNTKKSALSVQAVAQSEWAASVRKLQYVVQLKEGQVSCSIEKLHPLEVSDVLSDLSQFGNLEKLSLAYLLDYKGVRAAVDSEKRRSGFHDSPEHAAYQESKYVWRALLAAGLHAFGQNSSYGRINALEIHNLTPFPVSVFDSEQFHNFLSQLKTFNVSFPELSTTGRFGVEYTMYSYQLGQWFFKNLASVENLDIDAGRAVPLGEHGNFIEQNMCLRECRMPNLRNVKFHSVFVCREMIEFLTNHAGTLESITLDHCYATHVDQPNLEHWVTRWWSLFEALIAMHPTKLVSFELTFARKEEGLIDWEGPQLPYDKEWYNQLKKLEVRRHYVFPYGQASPIEGLPYPNTDSIEHSIREGRDKRSYLSLMAIVESNARRKQG